MSILDAVDTHFSATYQEARGKFLAACSSAEVRSIINPNLGPEGEELATDIAWFGPPDASRVFMMISSTHGVEGFCGSACQLDWITEGGPAALGPDTAVMLVHAINPYGFAWIRRVTEEGCDLNRNYLDFSKPLPENPGHDELVDAFVPASLDAETLKLTEAKIAAWRAEHGEFAFQTARKAGQYKHAHSMFFGGFAPSWARRTLENIIADYELPARRMVTVVDYHTGLGSFGYGEPISGHLPDTLGLERILKMYGHSVGVPESGTSASIPLHGTSRDVWDAMFNNTYTYVALEFGTFSPENGRLALRGDHWLHNQGEFDWNAPETRAIKAALRLQYYPETPDWKEMVLWRSRQMQRQSLWGLETLA